MAVTSDRDERYPAIGDYALIGDCHTAALVSRAGSIDWFCPQRFDAPAVFCRILDWDKGGHCTVAPASAFEVERAYRGDTPILETIFRTDSGRARLVDVMPVFISSPDPDTDEVGSHHQITRRLEVLDGQVRFRLTFKPTFDFARAPCQFDLTPGEGVVARAGDQFLTLSCPGCELTVETDAVTACIDLTQGESYNLILTWTTDPDEARSALRPLDPADRLAVTADFWDRWAEKCEYHGRFEREVRRSAVTLKLLTYEPTSAIVAAPTTSLPEQIGGPRNWDYRFTWLRDSSLILYALMTIGYRDEAGDFFAWLETTIATAPRPLHILYPISRDGQVDEDELSHLEGYRGSRPVRVGNGAATQLQLDVYGEVLRAAGIYFRLPDGEGGTGVSGRTPTDAEWAMLRELADTAASSWQQRDRGIWEVRGEPREFLYSRLMCWAALDAAAKIARDHDLDAPFDLWHRECHRIREEILTRGYNSRLGAFTQALDGETLDASALVIPIIGFLPATDERVTSTVELIRRDLSENGLVYRYRTSETDDGVDGDEGTFAMCSYWLADALALAGKVDDAIAVFERVTGYANDVGLLAEEISPHSGELLGNFPQGFTHLALIRAAVDISRSIREGGERGAVDEPARSDAARHHIEQQSPRTSDDPDRCH